MNEHEAEQLVKHNQEVYEKIAPHFAATRRALWEDLKSLRRFVKDGDSVLDLGCGSGRLVQLFGELKIKYLGVDQSDELITLARQNYPAAEFVVADMRQVPRPDRSFDLIFAVAALHHLPTRAFQLEALREMRRLAKPNAPIILTNWNLLSRSAREKVEAGEWSEFAPGEFYVPWKDGQGIVRGERYYHAFRPEELCALIKECGGETREQFFSRQGVVAESSDGDNLITVSVFNGQ